MPRVTDKALDDLEEYFEHQRSDLEMWCMERGIQSKDVLHEVKMPEKEAFDLIADLRDARAQLSRALVAVRAYRALCNAYRFNSNKGVDTALDQLAMANVDELLRA